MSRRIHRRLKKLTAVLTAGTAFQMTGCTIDFNQAAADLVNAIGTQIIADFVFGFFNLIP